MVISSRTSKVSPFYLHISRANLPIGRESYAVVEFAPFQKVPPASERIKVDARLNTIDKGCSSVEFCVRSSNIAQQMKITSRS